MMLQREICESKIEELCEQYNSVIDDFNNGKCSYYYMQIITHKIQGEIRGIAYTLGKDVELKMGMEE